tara:strand:+ start:864 stop:1391 length:528 start_codon:yes stop_codon:yes gene_type:complete
MNLREILAISGKPGLYKTETNRDNGLIASELGSNKKSFYPSRQHMFTPLENITIYTENDAIELVEVFKILKKDEKVLIKANSSADELRAFFVKVVPDHDQEKVYTSDIKKIIKWYNMLNEFGFLKEETKEEKEGAKKTTKKVVKKATTKKALKQTAKPKSQNVKKVEKRGSQRGT